MFNKDLDRILAEHAQTLRMTPSEKTFNRRWYDRHEHVGHFIARMGLFPARIQEVLCTEIADAVEDMFKLQDIDSNRSIGIEKVLRLWGSKRKLRGYDQTLPMHRMVTYLSILPETNCEQVVAYSNALVDKTVDYLQMCVHAHKPVLLTEVRGLSHAFFSQASQMSPLREGGALYRRVAEQMEAQIPPEPKSLPMPQKRPQPASSSDIIRVVSEKTWVDTEDMRIRSVRSEPGWA